MALPKKVAGTSKLTVWLNQLLDEVRALRPSGSGDLRVDFTRDGVRYTLKPGAAGAGATLKPFRFVEMFGDYVSARSLDGGVVGTELVYLILPFELRRSEFHQKTIPLNPDNPGASQSLRYTYSSPIRRTAELLNPNGAIAETEVQQIIPLFIKNFTLLHALPATPDNAITFTPGHTNSGLQVVANGRAWTKVP